MVDATNLRRNLFLVTQLAELGLPIVLALMGPVLWLRARLLKKASGSGDRYARLSFGGLLSK